MFLKNLFYKTSPGKNPEAEKTPSIAVFIDAENISPANIHSFIKEAALHGNICIKEAFACGTLFEKNGWKNTLLLHAVKPLQGLRAKRGKNASDIALTARAVQVFYKIKPDATFIISGDSDYSPLVQLLRQENHKVTVISKMNVSESYINSVENLIFEETLPGITLPQSHKKPEAKPAVSAISSKPNMPHPRKINTALLDRAYEITTRGKTGYPSATNFNKSLKKLDTAFHYESYGFRSFKEFLLSLKDQFEIIPHTNNSLYIKKIQSK